MDQLRKDVSELLILESLNAQRIDKLNDGLSVLRESIRDSVAQLDTGVATQAQTLSGFRELYLREIGNIHNSIADVKNSLDSINDGLFTSRDKINAVEKDIAVARGSFRGAVVTWSGFMALVAFAVDKSSIFSAGGEEKRR